MKSPPAALARQVAATPLDASLRRRYALALDAEAQRLHGAARVRKQIEADCQRELADLLPAGEVVAGSLLAVRLDLPRKKGAPLAACKVYGLLRGEIAYFVCFPDRPEASGARQRAAWLEGLAWWTEREQQEGAGESAGDELVLTWEQAS